MISAKWATYKQLHHSAGGPFGQDLRNSLTQDWQVDITVYSFVEGKIVGRGSQFWKPIIISKIQSADDRKKLYNKKRARCQGRGQLVPRRVSKATANFDEFPKVWDSPLSGSKTWCCQQAEGGFSFRSRFTSTRVIKQRYTDQNANSFSSFFPYW